MFLNDMALYCLRIRLPSNMRMNEHERNLMLWRSENSLPGIEPPAIQPTVSQSLYSLTGHSM
jgi:hypothetical protein